MIFKSAVSSWLYLALVVMLLGVSVCLYPILNQPVSPVLLLALILISILAIGLPLWMVLVTDYRVKDGVLKIRSGPLCWTLPLDAIQKVTPTRSLRSSPALSAHRLTIEYDRGRTIQVSPADTEAFLRAIGHASLS